jgi:uncharacterized RDD family membrane protein YckC
MSVANEEKHLASMKSRGIAFVIDILVLGMSKLLTGMIFGMVMLSAFDQDPKTAADSTTSQIAFLCLHFILSFLIFVFPTRRNGKTLGKSMMKIAVDFGEAGPSLGKVVFREFVAKLWPLHFAEMGLFAMIFDDANLAGAIPAFLFLLSAASIYINGENKSIHDLVAGTVVVRTDGTV